jgi:hypothetical protein
LINDYGFRVYKKTNQQILIAASVRFLYTFSATSSFAGDGLGLSIKPYLLSTEISDKKADTLRKARILSGMQLTLKNSLLNFSANYNVQSFFGEEPGIQTSDISQRLNTS